MKSDYLISLLPGELTAEQDNVGSHHIIKQARIINIAPNPFCGFTQIQFEVLTEGNIAFEVCDISGRKLKTIYSGYMKAGVYNLELNLTDIENGVYIISILYNSTTADTYKISVF